MDNTNTFNTIMETYSQTETMNFAYQMGKNSKKGDVFCLCGDLGVGKTQFTKGFAKGLGINDDITSPTFTIVNEYSTNNFQFYHFDVYRISNIDELYDIGYEEYFFSEAICLIEWADMIKDIIPQNATWITITKNLQNSEDYRLIEVVKNDNIGN